MEFTQSLFSTTFFTFGDNGWKSSGKFWLYWAVTIPSTVLVVIAYSVFSNDRIRKRFRWIKRFRPGTTPKPNSVV